MRLSMSPLRRDRVGRTPRNVAQPIAGAPETATCPSCDVYNRPSSINWLRRKRACTTMRAWVGNTDWQWFSQLAQEQRLEEVNFWQPGGRQRFGTLEPGELFLFRLKSPRNAIVVGGVF